MHAALSTLASLAFAAFFTHAAHAGDVQTSCKQAGVKVLELKYRNRAANLNLILNTPLGPSALADFIRRTTKRNDLAAAAIDGNKEYLPESSEKRLF